MWKDILIGPETLIVEAIKIIDHGDLQIALVVDEKKKLLGTLTDGDIRRAILRHVKLDEPVERIMNRSPHFVFQGQSRQSAVSLMRNYKVRQIPVVDQDFYVVGIQLADELLNPPSRENWVILMAGGLGQRLHPLTEACPKPLLKVGGKPLLETILDSFIEQGFKTFFISVNYKADMIMEHFGDGVGWGVDIQYIQEGRRLGTAGALGLLPQPPQLPIIMMNGDILTKVNYGQLLEFHKKNHSDASICIKEQHNQIPYGVVRIDQNRLQDLEEKPSQHFFINAGLYVFNREVLAYVPPDTHFDIPDLLRILLQEQKTVSAFPIREYWIDIGRFDDYEKANNEFTEVFG